MKLDTSLDLIGIARPVTDGRLHLGASQVRLLEQGADGIGPPGKISEPEQDLPDVGSPEETGASAGRAVPEGDQWMLVTAGALFGIAPETVGEGLPPARARTRSLSARPSSIRTETLTDMSTL